MGIRTYKAVCSGGLIAVMVLGLAGCSGSKKTGAPQDASPDAVPDADPACLQMQRDYVNAHVAPDQQTDVTSTVHGVLGAADFPQAMPYCSGARPTGN